MTAKDHLEDKKCPAGNDNCQYCEDGCEHTEVPAHLEVLEGVLEIAIDRRDISWEYCDIEALDFAITTIKEHEKLKEEIDKYQEQVEQARLCEDEIAHELAELKKAIQDMEYVEKKDIETMKLTTTQKGCYPETREYPTLREMTQIEYKDGYNTCADIANERMRKVKELTKEEI